jgi:hypothetical protein
MSSPASSVVTFFGRAIVSVEAVENSGCRRSDGVEAGEGF